MSQCYVLKQMLNALACTVELWMHLGGLLRAQEAIVGLSYRLVRLLRFFRAQRFPACIHNSIVHAMAFTMATPQVHKKALQMSVFVKYLKN